MYGTLSEMLLDHGLRDIEMLDLMGLPESQDYLVRGYLRDLLDSAIDGDEDDFAAATMICAELERLWDEGVELAVEDGRVVDTRNFWRMLTILPMVFFHLEGDDDVDDDDDSVVLNYESFLEVLATGFDLCRDIPLRYSDFEAQLVSVPERACYDFLMRLDDEARLQCLMRLALADEGWLFQMNEEVLRIVLLEGGSVVRNSMVQLLDGLDVEFTLSVGAPCDPAWVEACDCDCCVDGVCDCDECCELDG